MFSHDSRNRIQDTYLGLWGAIWIWLWLILNFSSPIFHLFFTPLGYTGLLLVLENSKHSFITAFAFASVVIFQILAWLLFSLGFLLKYLATWEVSLFMPSNNTLLLFMLLHFFSWYPILSYTVLCKLHDSRNSVLLWYIEDT